MVTGHVEASILGGLRHAATTPEALWARHGRRLRRFATRALNSDEAGADAVCCAVMLRAARDLQASRSGVPACDLRCWLWLRRIAVEVVADIQCNGTAPAWVDRQPLPRILPAWLRTHLRIRAIREVAALALERHGDGPISEARARDRRRWHEAFERRLRDLSVLWLFPRRLWRAAEDTGRTARDWWRRVEVSLPTGVSSSQRLAGLLTGSPVLSDAAAAVTAAIVLGIAGAAPAAAATARATMAVSEKPSAIVGAFPHPRSELPPSRAPEPVVGDEVVSSAPTGAASSSPDQGQGSGFPATLVASAPNGSGVTAEASPSVSEPISQTQYEGGTEFHTPDARVTVDADGDGGDEASIGAPVVQLNCPAPSERRGPVTGPACPVLEETDLNSEPWE